MKAMKAMKALIPAFPGAARLKRRSLPVEEPQKRASGVRQAHHKAKMSGYIQVLF